MTGVLIHPGFTAALATMFDRTATIQSYTESQAESGMVTRAWSSLYTLVPCMVGPAGGTEARTTQLTLGITYHQVLLGGYYPAITPSMRAVVSSTTYEITVVEHDTELSMTRLTCKRAE